MRITCPNCGAQYNVPDAAIPKGGREVQCSSCQQTWFQQEKASVPRTISKIIEKREEAPQIEERSQPSDRPVSRIVTTPKDPPKQQLDADVASILQEEAAVSAPRPRVKSELRHSTEIREARRSFNVRSVSGLERSAEDVDPNQTRARIAQMAFEAQETEEQQETPEQDAEPKRNFSFDENPIPEVEEYDPNLRTVPDLDEMNATLRARKAARNAVELTEAEVEEANQRKGFRRGFFFVIFIFVLPLVPYVFEDALVSMYPQTADFLARYTNVIDGLRASVSGLFN